MPIVIKNSELLSLLKALSALDGHPEAVTLKDASGREHQQLVMKPYRFGGTVRLTLVRWLTEVKKANDVLGSVHDALVRQFSAGGLSDQVAPENMPEFTKDWEKVLDGERSFDLPQIPIGDLMAEQNQLPLTVLAILQPLCV